MPIKLRKFLAIAMLMGLPGLAGGCLSEPEPQGSCFYREGVEDACVDTTESQCASDNGTFNKAGNCIVWDLFHPPT